MNANQAITIIAVTVAALSLLYNLIPVMTKLIEKSIEVVDVKVTATAEELEKLNGKVDLVAKDISMIQEDLRHVSEKVDQLTRD